MYVKECFYDLCDHVFESENIGYELCPECGSETIPNEVSLSIKKRAKSLTNKYARESEYHGSYLQYFSCPFGYRCFLAGNYQPSCSNRTFRHECLLPLQNEQEALHHKFDEILIYLHKIDQKLQ